MKIECPSCRLSGNVNDVELPPEGRYANCPRCKAGFHIAKPAPVSNSGSLMNTCPACRYSTFTEEMFAVCPKCGTTKSSYGEIRSKQAARKQLQHDQEVLLRSVRNPDLIKALPDGAAPAQTMVPGPILLTSRGSIAVGGALLCFGLAGLAKYYGKDWQTILSEPLLEPVSRVRIFFSLGFLPWLRTLFSIALIIAATRFLNRKRLAHRGMIACSWGGVALGVITETAGFINWVKLSSSSPSFSYYAIGFFSALFMTLLWTAPFFALLWYLRRDIIIREFSQG